MKQTLLLFLILCLQMPLNSFGQKQSFTRQEKDSVLKVQFAEYLEFLWQQPNDQQVVLDTTRLYQITFNTFCSLPRPSQLPDPCYGDSAQLFCIQRPEKNGNGLLSFAKSTYTMIDSGYTSLTDSSNLRLWFATFQINGADPPHKGSFSIISFAQGKYLICTDRILDSYQPGDAIKGYDDTAFLERND